jgi:hypothetical protein
MTLTIKTNNVPRYTVGVYDLTPKERAEFDYLDDIDSATLFRYHGNVYDLGVFMRIDNRDPANPLKGWHGYHSDSYFSGIAIKISDDGESVIVGTYYS